MQRVCVSVRVSVYIIIVHSPLHWVLVYMLRSARNKNKGKKKSKLLHNNGVTTGIALMLKNGMKK